MQRESNVHALAELKRILARDGLRPALVYLNGLTTHRFTALYRFDGAMLHNLCFFDRENPHASSSADIPVLASYCVFVRDSGHRFSVLDSFCDERVAGHPKQRQVRAYCGVPLLDRDGRMFGTICHFNLDPLPIADVDVELMEAIAWLIHPR